MTKKSSSSATEETVDDESKTMLQMARKRAQRGEKFTMSIPVKFTTGSSLNEVTVLDPYGVATKRPTATKGGAATLKITGTGSTEVSVTVNALALTADSFSFDAMQPHVQGTLDVETGVFQVRTQIMGMQTPETRLTFEWLGAANGTYDFESGKLTVLESGVGSYLPKKKTASVQPSTARHGTK